MSDEQLVRIEAKIDQVIASLEKQDRRLTAVEVCLETNIPQSIAQIAEGHAMLQESMDRGFAEVKKHLDEQSAPLEETVRQHSAAIKSLRSPT